MVILLPDLVVIPLRLLLGILFMAHGYPKLKQLEQTGGFLASLGFKPGKFWAVILGLNEFLGGLAILLGFATRIASTFLVISMLVAVWANKFKWQKKFVGGYEFDLALVASLVTLFLLGAGSVSVDTLIGWSLG